MHRMLRKLPQHKVWVNDLSLKHERLHRKYRKALLRYMEQVSINKLDWSSPSRECYYSMKMHIVLFYICAAYNIVFRLLLENTKKVPCLLALIEFKHMIEEPNIYIQSFVTFSELVYEYILFYHEPIPSLCCHYPTFPKNRKNPKQIDWSSHEYPKDSKQDLKLFLHCVFDYVNIDLKQFKVIVQKFHLKKTR